MLSALSSEISQDGSTWLTVSTFKLEEEICVITHKSSQLVRNKITALKIPGRRLWKCCVIPSVKVPVSVALFCKFSLCICVGNQKNVQRKKNFGTFRFKLSSCECLQTLKKTCFVAVK